MKTYRKWLGIIFGLDLGLIAGLLFFQYKSQIPNQVWLVKGKEASFQFDIPASGKVYSQDEAKSIGEDTYPVINLREPFTMSGSEEGSYTMDVLLFGILPLKTVDVTVMDEAYAIPCGTPVGIYVQTEGVMVIDTGMVTDTEGQEVCPALNIVKSGDYITKVNGESVNNKKELIETINEQGEDSLVLTIVRNHEETQVKVSPVMTGQDEYKLGLWVRDDMQGIGTLTYIMGDSFGALGHSINDADTGEMVAVDKGSIYLAKVAGILKGKAGEPGEIEGMIQYDASYKLGTIEGNSEFGIYGEYAPESDLDLQSEALPIGLKQEVQTGTAYIRSSVSGEVKDYEIEIVSVDKSNKNASKSMEIRIVDPELITLTGGIVQGMSGTPIIQNGKLIGAVTHVFVQDSTRGYGTFVENMIEETKKS